MLWCVGSGGRMTLAKLLLPFLMLQPFSEASNQPPSFNNYFFKTYLLIYENTAIGSSVTQLRADDPEGEPLIYGVVGEEAMRYFAVDRETGVVWLKQTLDRESVSQMQVEFSVSDSQGVVKDTVNILIGDVNDNAPSFHGLPYTVHIPERIGATALEFCESCGADLNLTALPPASVSALPLKPSPLSLHSPQASPAPNLILDMK
ncbi:unnamed protein product [Arctogadus glacialis]